MLDSWMNCHGRVHLPEDNNIFHSVSREASKKSRSSSKQKHPTSSRPLDKTWGQVRQTSLFDARDSTRGGSAAPLASGQTRSSASSTSFLPGLLNSQLLETKLRDFVAPAKPAASPICGQMSSARPLHRAASEHFMAPISPLDGGPLDSPCTDRPNTRRVNSLRAAGARLGSGNSPLSSARAHESPDTDRPTTATIHRRVSDPETSRESGSAAWMGSSRRGTPGSSRTAKPPHVNLAVYDAEDRSAALPAWTVDLVERYNLDPGQRPGSRRGNRASTARGGGRMSPHAMSLLGVNPIGQR